MENQTRSNVLEKSPTGAKGLTHVLSIERRKSFVYVFMGAVSGRFKVGFSRDPDRRLKDMQPGSPEVLEEVARWFGGQKEEAELHSELEEFRLHGEWFSPNPEALRKLIWAVRWADRREAQEHQRHQRLIEEHRGKCQAEGYTAKIVWT